METWIVIMTKSFCELLLQFFPQISEYEELQWTCIAACVLNIFLFYTAIMLNSTQFFGVYKRMP